MRSSRGMGAIRASKMPAGKTITRKDNPDKVKMFRKGGMASGGETSEFGKAFRAARAAGKSTFSWNGKKYTTELASAKKSPVSTPKYREPSPLVKTQYENASKPKPEAPKPIPTSSDDPEVMRDIARRRDMDANKGRAPAVGAAMQAKRDRLDDEDGDGMAKGGKAWIKGAIKKPGALHADLGVPKGKKIPAKMLAKAAKAPGKLGQRARFAEVLKGMRKK